MRKSNLLAPKLKTHPPRVNLVLERRDPARNMARYYVLRLDESLFGDVALVREWGRLGHLPRRCVELHGSADEAEEALDHWLTRKTRRGYTMARLS